MTDLLDGKVALITGGARGLGRAIADRFGQAGARGLVADIVPSAAPPPEGWQFETADVAVEAEVARIVERTDTLFGRLDIVVANAGVAPRWQDTEAVDLADWDRALAVNVRGVMATIKHAVPLMKQRGGSILAMGSTNAWIGHPKQAAYTASKHAVLGIVRAAAHDIGRYGIRVNALCPGPVATEALLERIRQRAQAGGETMDETLRSYGETALGRMPTAEDVAGAALFLASDLASGVTGQLLAVDAGGTL
ncbi:MAG: SDR family oxidoreductase [Alphaproteobacteria bacterium]|nr:SDR family oxidoreductase [Alphaproteobacteria bacterium]